MKKNKMNIKLWLAALMVFIQSEVKAQLLYELR